MKVKMMFSTYQDGCCSRILLFGFLGPVRDVSVASVIRRGGALLRISELLRDASLDIWAGGGGLEFLLLANFFLPPTESNLFLGQEFFFSVFRQRNFLSYAFPIMYVTILCYFSSISTTIFFSAHIFNFFF